MSGSKKISDKNSASFRGYTKPPALQVDSLLRQCGIFLYGMQVSMNYFLIKFFSSLGYGNSPPHLRYP